MRNETIKVGAKSKSQRAQVTLTYKRPETVAECVAICEGNESAVASLFNRGYTIWLQDRFGRPMFEEGKSAEEIQAAFASAVPGKTKGTSRKQQKSVVIPQGKRQFSAEEVAALLAKQGINVIPA
jgi:hypothetical protein